MFPNNSDPSSARAQNTVRLPHPSADSPKVIPFHSVPERNPVATPTPAENNQPRLPFFPDAPAPGQSCNSASAPVAATAVRALVGQSPQTNRRLHPKTRQNSNAKNNHQGRPPTLPRKSSVTA